MAINMIIDIDRADCIARELLKLVELEIFERVEIAISETDMYITSIAYKTHIVLSE